MQGQVCEGARASRAAAVTLKVSLLLSGAVGRLHRRRPVLQPSTAPEQLSPLSHGWWRIQPAVPPGWEPAPSQGHCGQICSPQKGKEIFPSIPMDYGVYAECEQHLTTSLNKLFIYKRFVFLWFVPCRQVLVAF